MTRRRCWQGTLALGAVLVAGNALAGVQNAGLFELDGNVADDSKTQDNDGTPRRGQP